MKTFPISRRFSRPAIHHQIFRLLRHLRVEVVQQHPQRRLLLPPFARNLRPPRCTKRALGQDRVRGPWHRSWYGHAHQISSPPLILAHASPFCTCSDTFGGAITGENPPSTTLHYNRTSMKRRKRRPKPNQNSKQAADQV